MKNRFIISGGGTGGHIFPALAIANRIKKEIPEADILFIGADNKMEMRRVPEAGYPIEGLTIYGISRDFSAKGITRNLKLPFVLLKSYNKAKKIIKQFDPELVIGVGGFASGPALRAANALKIPTLIQEQNSYPGVTNKMLAKQVRKICVAYDGLEQYFPADKIVKTGNPVRDEIIHIVKKTDEAYQFFGFSKEKKTILVVGGSLGCQTFNRCMAAHLDEIEQMGVQLLWQTGESFYKNIDPALLARQNDTIKIVPFIKNMNHAYGVADLIVSRAGALAISELTIVGSPTILVPFPYAAEDHQTKNAYALSSRKAAYLIPDNKAKDELMPLIKKLMADEDECRTLSENIKAMAQPDAIDAIMEEIKKIIGA